MSQTMFECRVTTNLTQKQNRDLERMCFKQGRKKADVIRDAVKALIMEYQESTPSGLRRVKK